MKPESRFCFVLHSHIPYVLFHGTWPHGSDWLYEAAAESYLPLLQIFLRLLEEGVLPAVTISFTPVLLDQMSHDAFREGLERHLQMKIEAALDDSREFNRRGESKLSHLALSWVRHYEELIGFFKEKIKKDIGGAFRLLQKEGHIEIIASAATHAYLPLLSREESLSWQVRQGILSYQQAFGSSPRGFWLPECGYRPGGKWMRPGIDEILAREGLHYFFVSGSCLREKISPIPYREFIAREKEPEIKNGQPNSAATSRVHRLPLFVQPSGLAVFIRDELTGELVWSRDKGYPGDGAYLEFHKKHFPGGLRYWRITSLSTDLGGKIPYDPEQAASRLREHARHFVSLIEEELGREPGVVTALYDTELFGHWWFEGPEWLYLVLGQLASSPVRPATVGRALESFPPAHMVQLSEGSWGKGGNHQTWWNEATRWIWQLIWEVEEKTMALVLRAGESELYPRLERQFLREKFLLESSDWPFLITTGSAADYGARRASEHASRARSLASWLNRSEPLSPQEETLLRRWEEEDQLFPEIINIKE